MESKGGDGMRLIDADAITYESIDSSDTGRHWQYHGTGIIAVRKKDIDEMPPIQSEIIRCKDCKHKPSGNAAEHDVIFPDDASAKIIGIHGFQGMIGIVEMQKEKRVMK